MNWSYGSKSRGRVGPYRYAAQGVPGKMGQEMHIQLCPFDEHPIHPVDATGQPSLALNNIARQKGDRADKVGNLFECKQSTQRDGRLGDSIVCKEWTVRGVIEHKAMQGGLTTYHNVPIRVMLVACKNQGQKVEPTGLFLPYSNDSPSTGGQGPAHAHIRPLNPLRANQWIVLADRIYRADENAILFSDTNPNPTAGKYVPFSITVRPNIVVRYDDSIGGTYQNSDIVFQVLVMGLCNNPNHMGSDGSTGSNYTISGNSTMKFTP